MDAIEVLRNDHDTVRELFEQLNETSIDDQKSRDQIFNQLKQELRVHAQIEEEIFYPVLASESELADVVQEAVEEHAAVKDILDEMEQLSSNSEAWENLLASLQDNVEHHVDEEEGDVFEQAQELITEESLNQLGKELQERKIQLRQGDVQQQAKRSMK